MYANSPISIAVPITVSISICFGCFADLTRTAHITIKHGRRYRFKNGAAFKNRTGGGTNGTAGMNLLVNKPPETYLDCTQIIAHNIFQKGSRRAAHNIFQTNLARYGEIFASVRPRYLLDSFAFASFSKKYGMATDNNACARPLK